MFYLTTHSTHFLYLSLYGVGHKEKDHSDSERGNSLLPLFPVENRDQCVLHEYVQDKVPNENRNEHELDEYVLDKVLNENRN